jgi:uncharacterized membrane protein YagU involved in acid resistance
MKAVSARLVLAGVAATVVMTAMMMFVAPMMGVHMDIAASLSGMMGLPWAAGMAAHLMIGVLVFPLVFSFALANRLPGNSVVRGILFGAVLWLMMEVAVMPMLGAGFFGLNGPGMMGAAAALMAHLVYGAILGSISASRTNAAQLQAAPVR